MFEQKISVTWDMTCKMTQFLSSLSLFTFYITVIYNPSIWLVKRCSQNTYISYKPHWDVSLWITWLACVHHAKWRSQASGYQLHHTYVNIRVISHKYIIKYYVAYINWQPSPARWVIFLKLIYAYTFFPH